MEETFVERVKINRFLNSNLQNLKGSGTFLTWKPILHANPFRSSVSRMALYTAETPIRRRYITGIINVRSHNLHNDLT